MPPRVPHKTWLLSFIVGALFIALLGSCGSGDDDVIEVVNSPQATGAAQPTDDTEAQVESPNPPVVEDPPVGEAVDPPPIDSTTLPQPTDSPQAGSTTPGTSISRDDPNTKTITVRIDGDNIDVTPPEENPDLYFKLDDWVRLTIYSDIANDEVHIHGYDHIFFVSEPRVDYQFGLYIPGQFEVELEERGIKLFDFFVTR